MGTCRRVWTFAQGIRALLRCSATPTLTPPPLLRWDVKERHVFDALPNPRSLDPVVSLGVSCGSLVLINIILSCISDFSNSSGLLFSILQQPPAPKLTFNCLKASTYLPQSFQLKLSLHSCKALRSGTVCRPSLACFILQLRRSSCPPRYHRLKLRVNTVRERNTTVENLIRNADCPRLQAPQIRSVNASTFDVRYAHSVQRLSYAPPIRASRSHAYLRDYCYPLV